MFWGLILLILFVFALCLVATALLAYAAVRTIGVLLREPALRTPRRITGAIAATIGLVVCVLGWYRVVSGILDDNGCWWCHG